MDKAVLMRKVDELSYQLDREGDIAANQIAIKNRQLEIKNAEIAQLQQQMKELRQRIAADVAQPVGVGAIRAGAIALVAHDMDFSWVSICFSVAFVRCTHAATACAWTYQCDVRPWTFAHALLVDAVEPANQAPLAEQEIRGRRASIGRFSFR